MPARKPSALNKKHLTKAERSARTAAEASTTPKTFLQKQPPPALNGHVLARATWKELIELYGQAEGILVTAFDANLLIKYCLIDEECGDLVALRTEVRKEWERHVQILKDMDPDPQYLKVYFGALTQANALLQRYQGLDARLDAKRKLLVFMEQSLYLTPRSRAGVAPTAKEPEKPSSDLAKAMDAI